MEGGENILNSFNFGQESPNNNSCHFSQPDSPSCLPHLDKLFISGTCESNNDMHSQLISIEENKKPICKFGAQRKKNQYAYKLMLTLREEQYTIIKSVSNQSDKIIDVDNSDIADPLPSSQWIQNSLITLNLAEKEIIESRNWLTDNIIDAGQIILEMQFSVRFGKAGFQSVALGNTFSFTVESGEFVQILHDGHFHWLTISSVGATPCQIVAYDSFYPSAGLTTKMQIACLMNSLEKNLVVTFEDVQMQAGGSDCGVFVLAFAVVICFGRSPGKIHFNQHSMRSHLITCFENNQFTMFPIGKERHQRKTKSSEVIAVHCICRIPELKQVPMIQCTLCKIWYHGKHCLKVPDDAWLPGAKWLCFTN